MRIKTHKIKQKFVLIDTSELIIDYQKVTCVTKERREDDQFLKKQSTVESLLSGHLNY